MSMARCPASPGPASEHNRRLAQGFFTGRPAPLGRRAPTLDDVGTVIVTTTVDSADAADQISKAAVRARLAACGHVFGPITSTYWWQDKLETAQEWTVAFKTTEANSEAPIEHLRASHPYDVPEVLVTPVTAGNPAYLGWVESETRAS